ncbi:MAG: transglutaminaseTgpA domain-containing protein, partial [Aureliella sp.]
GAIVFAGFFFYLLPRTGPAQFEPSLGTQDRIGLPTTLSIGTVGRLLSDPRPVMRVSFMTLGTTQNYAINQPLYIRARTMDTYGEYSRNEWVKQGEWVFSGIHEFRRLRGRESSGTALDRQRDLVEVEFDIKQQFASTLFGLPPAFATAKTQMIPLEYDKFNMVMDELDPARLPRGKSLVYSVGTAAFAHGVQLPLTPAMLGSGKSSESRNLLRLSYDFRNFKRCDQYRQKLLQDGGVDLRNRYDAAKFLERHFTDGNFTYTLDLRPPIDPDIDPIEDFLINQRQGHCQYFASAMVVMLRQCGIPSRIVVGYTPREFNPLGKYFSVKQNDAHAWVEALMTRAELQGTELERWATDSESYWVRFDPTPAGTDNASTSQPGQAFDYAEKLWKDYVVEGQKLSSPDSLYAPVAANSENAYAAAVENFKQLSQKIAAGELFTSLGRIGFAWQAAILITAIGAFVSLLWQGSKLLQRYAPRFAGRLGLKRRPSAIKQAFFARCVALLAQNGLRREPHETPEEFTHRACQILTRSSPAITHAPLGNALDLLTEHYYRLRFGHNQTLSTVEQQSIDRALDQLLNAVQK